PVAEYNLNQAMIEAANNKTVIFISHRLSTTVNADKIYVMENGRIIESGSHTELMKLNGTYAYMFNLQAEKYKDE
ncbi:MAG: ABC transporter ATP-binding protein, partial [Clostridia bacterium]|nr:ABC transporter ATP-binding protein [Clostridia bacterium]